MGLILQKIRKDDVFRQVRRWVTPSENQKNIHIRMGLPASRIDVVPYYAQASVDFPAPPPNGAVLFLGRLSREKGVDILLRAWALLPISGRELWIAGTGAEEATLKKLSKELHLRNVRWLGFVPRQKHDDLWRQTSFSVIPSIWNEPYPLSFLEAWRNRRPFVGSRMGAMAEVLADGRGGWLAKPGCPQDLARQMQPVLDQPSWVEKAEIGRAHV